MRFAVRVRAGLRAPAAADIREGVLEYSTSNRVQDLRQPVFQKLNMGFVLPRAREPGRSHSLFTNRTSCQLSATLGNNSGRNESAADPGTARRKASADVEAPP